MRYINEEGGSFIGSSRGSFDANVIIDWLQRYNVHAIFIIGGDGSHRAAYRLYEEISSRVLYYCYFHSFFLSLFLPFSSSLYLSYFF